MAVVKKKLGAIPCPCCGHPVMVRENDAETLTIQCDGCDISAFAKKGTDAQKLWRAKLPGTVPKEEFQTPAAPAPVAAPAPEIVPAPKAKPFDPLEFLKKGAA